MFFIDSIIRVINFIRFYFIFILNVHLRKSIITHVIFFIAKNNLREMMYEKITNLKSIIK